MPVQTAQEAGDSAKNLPVEYRTGSLVRLPAPLQALAVGLIRKRFDLIRPGKQLHITVHFTVTTWGEKYDSYWGYTGSYKSQRKTISAFLTAQPSDTKESFEKDKNDLIEGLKRRAEDYNGVNITVDIKEIIENY